MKKVLMNVEGILRQELIENSGYKVSYYADRLDVARSSIYRAAETSKDIVILGGNVFLVRNNKFLSIMASHGVTVEGETVAKAIAFSRDRTFDPHSVFGLKFETDHEGNGILKMIQAFLIALSFDLPFTMELELE